MSQPYVVTKEVTMDALGGAIPIVRTWADPCSYPFRDIAIWISSRGQVTAALNLDWDVLYGGVWDGPPFDPTSGHSGGVSQANGALVGAIEYADAVHEDASVLPPNARITRPGAGGTDMGISGFPIVIELSNQKAAELTVWVTFVYRDLSDPM